MDSHLEQVIRKTRAKNNKWKDERVARIVSGKTGVSEEAVLEAMAELYKPRKLLRKAGIIAGIVTTLGALAAISYYAIAGRSPEKPPRPKAQIAKTIGDYSYDPKEGLIFKGDYADSIKEDGLMLRVKDWVWDRINQPQYDGHFRDVREIYFKSLKSRLFIRPLKKYEPAMFQEALDHVVKDYAELGLRTDFHLKPIKSIDDLATPGSGSTPVYLVKEIGNDVIAGTYAVHADGHKEKLPKYRIHGKLGGHSGGKTRLKDGKVKVESQFIFVNADKEDKGGVHFKIYCESLHYQLSSPRRDILKSIIEVSFDNGEFTYSNFDEAMKMGRLTEEAVVHALAQHWVIENKEKYGLSQESIDREIGENQRNFIYKGVPVILQLIEKQGRAAVLQDYIQNPVKYMEKVRAGVKEFRESPVKRASP
jgi:hypothetical protein